MIEEEDRGGEMSGGGLLLDVCGGTAVPMRCVGLEPADGGGELCDLGLSLAGEGCEISPTTTEMLEPVGEGGVMSGQGLPLSRDSVLEKEGGLVNDKGTLAVRDNNRRKFCC